MGTARKPNGDPMGVLRASNGDHKEIEREVQGHPMGILRKTTEKYNRLPHHAGSLYKSLKAVDGATIEGTLWGRTA